MNCYTHIYSSFRAILLSSLFYFLLCDNGVNAMNLDQSQRVAFINEQQLSTLYPIEIKQFWEQGRFGHFNGVDNIRVNYAEFISSTKSERQCIIIVPGRSEGYLKYKELAYELDRQGYNSFIIDHRGQGLSQRLLPNKFKGYVASFDDYVTDLQQFVDTVVLPKCEQKPYILAHSMGGLIAAHYMQKVPTAIQAAVLSSPMISINSGGTPKWLVKFLIFIFEFFNQIISNEPWYFIGQGDVTADSYSTENFTSTKLMQSPLRYEQFISLYRSTPALQLGGATLHWLTESLTGETKAFEQIPALSTPTIILQAGADTVVDNDAQNDFCLALNKAHPQSCPQGKPFVINDAKHELLFESDRYRDQALTKTLQWFKQH